MAKSFKDLRSKMAPEAQRVSRLKATAMLQAMPLSELRLARKLSQEQMAAQLNVKQAAVSKLERRADMYISTSEVLSKPWADIWRLPRNFRKAR